MTETPRKTGGNSPDIDTDADRFPTAVDALRRLASEGDFPEGQVQEIHIYALASGELTYKVLPARAEETDVGFVPPPD